MIRPTLIHKPKDHKQYVLFLCILVALIGLSACQPTEMVLPFDTIEQRDAAGTGQVYRDKQPGLMVITTLDEADDLDGLVTPEGQAQLRSLNYNAYFVIAVFQGRKPTTRYEIQIERITRRENEVTIYARFSEPKPDEEKAPEETSPYHLVQVQKTGAWGQPITFNLVSGNARVTSLSHHVP